MKTFEELCAFIESRYKRRATIEAWALASIEPNEEGRVLTGDLYRHYVAWAKAQGGGMDSHRALANMLRSGGIRQARSNGKRYFIGITLRD